jgi:transcriptional regulator with XRE-family HTH domain
MKKQGSVGDLLRQRREDQSLTQEEMARRWKQHLPRRCERNLAALANVLTIEWPGYQPHPNSLRTAADVYGLDYIDLLVAAGYVAEIEIRRHIERQRKAG